MDLGFRVGLYCDSNVIGGAEISMLTLAASYDRGAELVIMSPSPAVIDAAERFAPALERHRLRISDGIFGGFASHRRAFGALDLGLLQVTLPNPFASRGAQLAAVSLGIPTVAVQQLVLAPRRKRGAWLVRLLAYPLAGIVAVGERTASDLKRLYGIPASKVFVCHNGISAPAPPAVELGGRPVIGCVARYESQKGIDRLVRAVAEIPEARLVLVGDGSLRNDLEELAEDLHIADRVEVGPWRDDAREMIASFDVFALASVDEAFPLTIVEAMLARTPVVATDVGSVGEAVIDGKTGMLVRCGDHDALVRALRLVIEDPGLAERLTSDAYELAMERFTAEQMVTAYETVWQALVGDKPGLS